MKKIIKIILIVVFILFIILLTLPFLFKGKIQNYAQQEINKNLNAKVYFENLGLSFIKNFPNVSITLKKLSITGVDDFSTDTLFSIDKFEVVVNLSSLLKNEINIKKVILNKPSIHAIVKEDGKANWNITKPDTTLKEEIKDTTPSEIKTKIALRKFEIKKANIKYDDYKSKIFASIANWNLLLKGNFAKEFTNLNLISNIEKLNFRYGIIPYLKDVIVDIETNIDADLVNKSFSLKQNHFALNDLYLGFEGLFSMKDSDIVVDLSFATKKADFKSLLSLVPAIYKKDFKDIQTGGKLMLEGKIKGIYSKNTLPDVSLNLLVENAMFKYPSLPKTADNIQINALVYYDGKNMDNSTFDLKKFHVDLGGNPVDITFSVKSPKSDMNLKGSFKSNIDLVTFKDVVPLENTELSGKILSDLYFEGYMSYIEKQEYDKFIADGNLNISNLNFSSPSIPQKISINDAQVVFSPKFVELKSFAMDIGRSDIKLKGKLENFINYVFKNGTIKGNLELKSDLIDVNEFMTGEKTGTTQEVDTTKMQVIEIPPRIDFTFMSNIGKIYYDKLVIDNFEGIVKVLDQKLILEKVALNTLDGKMLLSGEYNTQDKNKPLVDFNFSAQDINIPAAVKSFSTLEKLAPIAKNTTGRVSISASYTCVLDQYMSPIINSIISKGSLSSKELSILKSGMFVKLGETLKTKAFDNMTLKDVILNFEIRDGKIFIEPFNIKVKNTDLLIGGTQGVDMTINYTMRVTMPKGELGKEAEALVNNLATQLIRSGIRYEMGENIIYDVKIGGTITDPKFTVSLIGQTGQSLKEEIKEKVKQELQQKKEEIKSAINAEAQKIIEDAEKLAAEIRKKANEAAEKTRNEANQRADQIVKQAKNPIEKKAAEITAKKIREEGEKRAQEIIKKGDEEVDKIIQQAKERAAKLTN